MRLDFDLSLNTIEIKTNTVATNANLLFQNIPHSSRERREFSFAKPVIHNRITHFPEDE
jgi:hypothetical protein